MRVLLTILIAILIGGGGAYAWRYYGGFGGEKGTAVAFVEAYGTYEEVSNEVERLVHLPGVANNDARAELLRLLSAILTESMEPGERETLARIAFTHLDTMKREIDAAQAAQARLYAVLQDFDNASRVFRGIELRTHASNIVLIARKRAELSARITSILSETNDHTYAIITRILADHGELTQEHIATINDATRQAEDRFATLEGLYYELVQKKKELEGAFTQFTRVAL
jgi:hypothetical protein